MGRLRISAISYLNTAPLMWDFEHGLEGRDFEISYTLPSGCAAALQAGSADIGIIPAAAYTTISDLLILPEVAIAARRAVRSILLVSKVPREEIRSVAMDTSSMTSVALTTVLFDKWWGGGRSFTAMAPELDPMLSQHDAALVIGDPALRIERSKYFTYDLAQEWIRLTGRPFVFAFWAIRAAAAASAPRDLAGIFRRSRDHGLEAANLDVICREWGPRVGLSEPDTLSYLTQNIHYSLDEDCLEGMRLYYQYAEECGALPRAPKLTFLA
jgi:chorismate dehydratase